MEKRKVRYVWKKLSLVSLLSLIALWILTGFGSGYFLRQNNLTMLDLREKVFTADKENVSLETSLKSLQTYVTTRMNTSLPKLGDQKAVQLKYTYDRLVAAEDTRVAAERVSVTNAAAAYCEANLPTVRLTERAKCVQDYIQARPVTPHAVAKELYSYDFYSPRWSGDLAGWLVITFVFLSVLLFCRIILGILVRHSLKS